MSGELEIAGLTDRGRVRVVNEDTFLAEELTLSEGRSAVILGVFDGCGGLGSGLVASAITRNVVSEMVGRFDGRDESIGEHLSEALRQANSEVYARAQRGDVCRGMGTTATTVAVVGETLYLAHIGDSRAYLLRDGVLHQVSRDHTLLNFLIAQGRILESEIESFEHANVVYQAVGAGSPFDVDTAEITLRREDVVLLATDGLYCLDRDEAAQLIESRETAEDVCEALIAGANERGGHDNVAVVVCRITGEGFELPRSDDEVPERSVPLPRRDAVSVAKAWEKVDAERPSTLARVLRAGRRIVNEVLYWLEGPVYRIRDISRPYRADFALWVEGALREAELRRALSRAFDVSPSQILRLRDIRGTDPSNALYYELNDDVSCGLFRLYFLGNPWKRYWTKFAVVEVAQLLATELDRDVLCHLDDLERNGVVVTPARKIYEAEVVHGEGGEVQSFRHRADESGVR